MVEDLDLLDDVAKKIMGRTICALGDAAGLCEVHAGEHEDELVAAVAHHHVARPELLLQDARYGRQGAIAGDVTEAIIEVLEVINVYEKERKCSFMSFCPFNLF